MSDEGLRETTSVGGLMNKIIFILITAFTVTNAYALPLPKGAKPVKPRPSIPTNLLGKVDFTAIVGLDDCSGSIIRFNTSLGSDLAMVLTNGHCYEGGFLNPGQVLVNVPSTRTFDLLNATADEYLATLTATRVIYSTMTNTDVTLYELQNTYDEIQKQYGVTALTLSATKPTAATEISIPSGYWRKIYSCSIDTFIYELEENGWTWQDSIRYTPGCDTIGGTSGSPIVDVSTHEVIGINNTSNEDGEKCTLDNPCEVDQQGNVTVHNQARYGEETYLFYGCFDAKNALDLGLPTCLLPKPQR